MAVSDGGGNVIYRFAYDTYGELSDIATDDGVSLKTTERPDTHGTMKEADAAGIPETAAQYTLAQLAHATGIDYLYNGQYGVMTDQNGLYYMRARYYDQDTKRFINRDVVSGSISNSQSLNRYSYVQGNPVSLTDPFGLCPDPNSNFKNFCVVLYNADWNAIGHGTLDVLGLFWEGFDVANALWYASEGKTEEAIACAVSALPGVGMFAGGLLAKTSKFKNAGKAVKYASRMTQGAIGTVAGAQITYTGLTNIINGIESGTLSAGDVLTFLGGIAITTLSGKNMLSSGRALQGVFDDVGKVSKAGKGQIAGKASGSYVAGDATFMDSNDAFLRNISNRGDIDENGYFDIIAHGTQRGIQITHNGKKIIVDSRTAARLIQNMEGYNGQKIRLLSCNTGALDNGFAQNLANKLNVEVLAPNNYLWSTANGDYFVAGMTDLGMPDMSNIGTFRLFKPGGN